MGNSKQIKILITSSPDLGAGFVPSKTQMSYLQNLRQTTHGAKKPFASAEGGQGIRRIAAQKRCVGGLVRADAIRQVLRNRDNRHRDLLMSLNPSRRSMVISWLRQGIADNPDDPDNRHYERLIRHYQRSGDNPTASDPVALTPQLDERDRFPRVRESWVDRELRERGPRLTWDEFEASLDEQDAMVAAKREEDNR